jgi:hypothetical protein
LRRVKGGDAGFKSGDDIGQSLSEGVVEVSRTALSPTSFFRAVNMRLIWTGFAYPTPSEKPMDSPPASANCTATSIK